MRAAPLRSAGWRGASAAGRSGVRGEPGSSGARGQFADAGRARVRQRATRRRRARERARHPHPSRRVDCNWRARRVPAARALSVVSHRLAHTLARVRPSSLSISARVRRLFAAVSPARDSDASSLSVSASASVSGWRGSTRGKKNSRKASSKTARLAPRARQDRTQRVTHGALVGQPDEVERARRVDDLAGTNAEPVPPPKDATKRGEVGGKARERIHLRTKASVDVISVGGPVQRWLAA